MRDYAFHNGLPPELSKVNSDDIILHNDADEVPSREVILFLKLHDNIPEPITLRFHHTIFGFFWYSGLNELQVGATFAMMKQVYNMSLSLLRKKQYLVKNRHLFSEYSKQTGVSTGPLVIGNRHYPAGFHCSWCFTPIGIRTKLISAVNADFPRWGDYPMKCELSYIKSLIAQGSWFAGNTCFKARTPSQANFAPKYYLQNSKQFSHLLINPYSTNAAKTCVTRKLSDHGVMMKNWHRMSKEKFLHHMNISHIAVPQNLLEVLKPQ